MMKRNASVDQKAESNEEENDVIGLQLLPSEISEAQIQ